MKKFKVGDELGITDIIVHSIKYLDAAAEIAERKEDSKALMQVFKESLKASDRIMQIILTMEEEDQEYIGEQGNQKGSFGFVTESGPKTDPSECELEESSE